MKKVLSKAFSKALPTVLSVSILGNSSCCHANMQLSTVERLNSQYMTQLSSNVISPSYSFGSSAFPFISSTSTSDFAIIPGMPSALNTIPSKIKNFFKFGKNKENLATIKGDNYLSSIAGSKACDGSGNENSGNSAESFAGANGHADNHQNSPSGTGGSSSSGSLSSGGNRGDNGENGGNGGDGGDDNHGRGNGNSNSNSQNNDNDIIARIPRRIGNVDLTEEEINILISNWSQIEKLTKNKYNIEGAAFHILVTHYHSNRNHTRIKELFEARDKQKIQSAENTQNQSPVTTQTATNDDESEQKNENSNSNSQNNDNDIIARIPRRIGSIVLTDDELAMLWDDIENIQNLINSGVNFDEAVLFRLLTIYCAKRAKLNSESEEYTKYTERHKLLAKEYHQLKNNKSHNRIDNKTDSTTKNETTQKLDSVAKSNSSDNDTSKISSSGSQNNDENIISRNSQQSTDSGNPPAVRHQQVSPDPSVIPSSQETLDFINQYIDAYPPTEEQHQKADEIVKQIFEYRAQGYLYPKKIHDFLYKYYKAKLCDASEKNLRHLENYYNNIIIAIDADFDHQSAPEDVSANFTIALMELLNIRIPTVPFNTPMPLDDNAVIEISEFLKNPTLEPDVQELLNNLVSEIISYREQGYRYTGPASYFLNEYFKRKQQDAKVSGNNTLAEYYESMIRTVEQDEKSYGATHFLDNHRAVQASTEALNRLLDFFNEEQLLTQQLQTDSKTTTASTPAPQQPLKTFAIDINEVKSKLLNGTLPTPEESKALKNHFNQRIANPKSEAESLQLPRELRIFLLIANVLNGYKPTNDEIDELYLDDNFKQKIADAKSEEDYIKIFKEIKDLEPNFSKDNEVKSNENVSTNKKCTHSEKGKEKKYKLLKNLVTDLIIGAIIYLIVFNSI